MGAKSSMFTNRAYATLCLTLACTSLLSFSQAQERLRAIEIYGSSQISIESLEETFGKQIRDLCTKFDDRATNDYAKQKETIEQSISQLGRFAFVELTIVEMYTSDHPIYVTVDLVDEDDRHERLKFHPAPSEELDDPNGLLDAWSRYQTISSALFRERKLPSIRANAYHSLWGFDHEELKPFGERFDREVEEHKSELIAVLRKAKNENDRANAAFLLAHIKNVDELIEALVPSIRDSSSLVRNNVMRVLASVARNHDGVPIEPIIEAANFPTATDRNKALATLRFLVESDEAKREVIEELGSELIAMLRLKNPINHNLAHVVLQRVSGEDYGESDYGTWQTWLDRSQVGN